MVEFDFFERKPNCNDKLDHIMPRISCEETHGERALQCEYCQKMLKPFAKAEHEATCESIRYVSFESYKFKTKQSKFLQALQENTEHFRKISEKSSRQCT